jgi:nucleotide-binding universal stress UspA family protein
LAELHAVVEKFTDQGFKIRVSTTRSTSSSRGILDVARENMASLLVLGIAKPSRSDVSLGPVAESVLPAAPCPVLLFRPGETTEYERVVIPVTSRPHSRFTSRLAMTLGQQQDLPVSALLVHEKAKSDQDPKDGSPDYWQDRGQLEAALVDIPGQEAVNRLILHAPDAVTGYLSELKVNDIAVVGFSDRGQWERWIHGDVPVALLKKWKGSLIIVSGAVDKTLVTSRIGKLRSWLTPTLTRFEKEEIERDARESAHASLDYTVLIIVSAVLATFGLLLDSAAVIIGAMLVAPLMLPLIAFSTGMTIGKIHLDRRATGTLIQGILAAFIIALIIGWIYPPNIAASEMLARGNPSFLDLGVAVATGFLGA